MLRNCSVIIFIFGAYRYNELKKQGVPTSEAIRIVGKQILYNFMFMLANKIIVSLIGNVPGIIFTAAISISMFGYHFYIDNRQRKLIQRIQNTIIDCNKPIYI